MRFFRPRAESRILAELKRLHREGSCARTRSRSDVDRERSNVTTHAAGMLALVQRTREAVDERPGLGEADGPPARLSASVSAPARCRRRARQDAA